MQSISLSCCDGAQGDMSAKSSDATKPSLDTLPPLPVEDPAELLALGELPSLPPPTPTELDELTQISEQPLHCDMSEWDWVLRLPPAPIHYNDYVGMIQYTSFWPPSLRTTKTSRCRINNTLTTLDVLRIHLLTNLLLLKQHGEYNLAQVFVEDPDVKSAQNSFAQSHCAISETLLDAHGDFGLPGYEAYRFSRNFFSHDYLTPRKYGSASMQEHFKGKIVLYNELYRHVLTLEKMLQIQLKDEDLWEEPKPAVARAFDADADAAWTYPDDEALTPHAPGEPMWVYSEPSEQEEFGYEWKPRGLLAKSFEALYFRSSVVRKVAHSVRDTISVIANEYISSLEDWETYPVEQNEGYGSGENEVGEEEEERDEWAEWARSEEVAISMP